MIRTDPGVVIIAVIELYADSGTEDRGKASFCHGGLDGYLKV